MNLLQAQILTISCLGVGSIIVGLLPACFVSRGRNYHSLLLTSLLCAGAGVLLSTTFIHILPEVQQQLQQNAELALCAGFLFVYFVDETINFLCGEAGHTRSTHKSNECNSNYGSYQTRESSTLLPRTSYHQPPYNPNFQRDRDTEDVCTPHGSTTNVGLCHVAHIEPCKKSSTGQIGLLIALTVHAVLEGLIIGVQASAQQVLILGSAIATHKLVIGFCLGLELSSTSTRCIHLFAILVFSLGSVGGIIIGMVFGENHVLWVNMPTLLPIVQAIAGGTLLYVTLAEVLPRERARWHERNTSRHAGLVQFVSVLFGFILMSILIVYLETEHQH